MSQPNHGSYSPRALMLIMQIVHFANAKWSSREGTGVRYSVKVEVSDVTDGDLHITVRDHYNDSTLSVEDLIDTLPIDWLSQFDRTYSQ